MPEELTPEQVAEAEAAAEAVAAERNTKIRRKLRRRRGALQTKLAQRTVRWEAAQLAVDRAQARCDGVSTLLDELDIKLAEIGGEG